MEQSALRITRGPDGGGVLRFTSGLVMEMNQPIQWPEPFPQVAKVMLVRDLCTLMDVMQADGFEFRPLEDVTLEERAAGSTYFLSAVTKFAIEVHRQAKPSMQNDWHFGAIVIGAIQFTDQVEADAGMVIAHSDEPGDRMPPEVMGLLEKYIALDREQFELESRSLSSLAAQADQASRTVH
jgi:hypothetical protein